MRAAALEARCEMRKKRRPREEDIFWRIRGLRERGEERRGRGGAEGVCGLGRGSGYLGLFF